MQISLIFDMDGVIVESNPYHKIAWKGFCDEHKRPVTDAELEQYVYGKTNPDALAYLFGDSLSREEAAAMVAQKEALFRELFRPHMQPVTGLTAFLDSVAGVLPKPAIATSAPPENVDFTLDTLGIRPYFSLIVDETMIAKGKPDPEIYLTTARRLGVSPAQCVVFEDSLAGLQAARAAGMTVVGVTTTHDEKELRSRADLLIADFSALARDYSPLVEAAKRKEASV